LQQVCPKICPFQVGTQIEFNTCIMKSSTEDPDEWITNLESIRSRLEDMNLKMTDEDLLMHVLNNLPKEYEIQQSKLEDRLSSTSNPLTIEDVRNELNLKYMRMKKSQTDSTGDEAEKALTTVSKRNKTKCRHCGKFGHKSTSCWDVVGKPEKKKPLIKLGQRQEPSSLEIAFIVRNLATSKLIAGSKREKRLQLHQQM